jgi:hypothetical protein
MKSIRIEYKKQRTSEEGMEEEKEEMNEEPTYCRLCNQSDREYELLLCDGCNTEGAYHASCLRLDQIPHGDFLCEECARTLHVKRCSLHGLVPVATPTPNDVSSSMVWMWGETVCVYASIHPLDLGSSSFIARPHMIDDHFTSTDAGHEVMQHIQSFLHECTWAREKSSPQPDIYQEFLKWYQRDPQLVTTPSETQFYQCFPSQFSLLPGYRIEDIPSNEDQNTHMSYLPNMDLD